MIPSTYFQFSDFNSRNYGIFIDGSHTYGMASRDSKQVTIPGVSGDFTFDNGRYNNIVISYDCVIPTGAAEKLTQLYAGLGAKSGAGMLPLTSSYFPGYTRFARLSGGIDPEITRGGAHAKFTISFECRAEKFITDSLYTGLSVTADGVPHPFHNATAYIAKPIIQCYVKDGGPSGTLTITGSFAGVTKEQTMILSEDIPKYNMTWRADCETKDFYAIGSSKNYNSMLSGDPGFPLLPSGMFTVAAEASLGTVKIIPRYYIL